jgi:hypothetical protein
LKDERGLEALKTQRDQLVEAEISGNLDPPGSGKFGGAFQAGCEESLKGCI